MIQDVSSECILRLFVEDWRASRNQRWHSTCAHTRARVASKKSLKSDVLPKGKICLVTKRVISIPQIFYAFSLSQLLYGTLAFPLGGYERGNLKPENIWKVDSVPIVCNLTRPISTFSASALSVFHQTKHRNAHFDQAFPDSLNWKYPFWWVLTQMTILLLFGRSIETLALAKIDIWDHIMPVTRQVNTHLYFSIAPHSALFDLLGKESLIRSFQ